MNKIIRTESSLRTALVFITSALLLCVVICGSLLFANNSARNAEAVIRHALRAPDDVEMMRLVTVARAEKSKEKVYARLSFSELALMPSLSVGFDIEALREDIRNLDLLNEDEQKVIDATYLSVYKQVLVIKLPMGYNGASFGVIFLGDNITSKDTVRHEYGHTRQLKDMGLYLYIVDVAIPSVMGNLLDRSEKLPYDYYGSYWESGADELGGVIRRTNNQKWPDGSDSSIWKLCAMFR